MRCDRRVLLVLIVCLLLFCLERATPWIACQGGTQACNDYDVLGRDLGAIPVDTGTYANMIVRLRNGEPYYQAWLTEVGPWLAEQGFTPGVFQTRTPWLISILAWLPDWCDWAVLVSIGVVACALLVWRRSWWTWGAVALVALGPLALLVNFRFVLEFELWAGVLILVSAAAYLRGIRWLGVLGGLLAVACREIAAPYLMLRVFWAWRDRRRGEMLGWGIGLALLTGGWIVHWLSLPAGTGADCRKWLYFGGVPQVLAAMRQSNWLLIQLPATFTGLLLFLVLLSPFWSEGREEKRAAIAGVSFVAFFACIGFWTNFYWGLMAAPLWCLTAACGASGGVRLAAGMLPQDSAVWRYWAISSAWARRCSSRLADTLPGRGRMWSRTSGKLRQRYPARRSLRPSSTSAPGRRDV